MQFNKEKFNEAVEKHLKDAGKEHLLQFAEDIASEGWEVLKIAAECTEDFPWDDIVVSSVDSKVKEIIDGIKK